MLKEPIFREVLQEVRWQISTSRTISKSFSEEDSIDDQLRLSKKIRYKPIFWKKLLSFTILQNCGMFKQDISEYLYGSGGHIFFGVNLL